MSATHPEINNQCGIVAALVVKTKQELIELAKGTHLHATCCAICGGSPARFGYYVTSEGERKRWHIGAFGFALCLECFCNPDATQVELAKRFEDLGNLNRSSVQGRLS